MAPLLTVKDLHVEFHTRDGVVKAVNSVTFSLERGTVLAILGESGSGKSVTLRSLVRLLPTARTQIAGEITLKGRNLYALSAGEMHNLRGSLVAMVFQEPMTALDPVYTVGAQIGRDTGAPPADAPGAGQTAGLRAVRADPHSFPCTTPQVVPA